MLKISTVKCMYLVKSILSSKINNDKLLEISLSVLLYWYLGRRKKSFIQYLVVYRTIRPVILSCYIYLAVKLLLLLGR